MKWVAYGFWMSHLAGGWQPSGWKPCVSPIFNCAKFRLCAMFLPHKKVNATHRLTANQVNTTHDWFTTWLNWGRQAHSQPTESVFIQGLNEFSFPEANRKKIFLSGAQREQTMFQFVSFFSSLMSPIKIILEETLSLLFAPWFPSSERKF